MILHIFVFFHILEISTKMQKYALPRAKSVFFLNNSVILHIFVFFHILEISTKMQKYASPRAKNIIFSNESTTVDRSTYINFYKITVFLLESLGTGLARKSVACLKIINPYLTSRK